MQASVLDLIGSNSHAVRFWLQRNGIKTNLSTGIGELSLDCILVIPGVLSFDSAMKQLCRANLDRVVRRHFIAGGKLIGICCGMQVCFEGSSEGSEIGLGILDGRIEGLSRGRDTVPNTGWKEIRQRGEPLKNIDLCFKSYFMHSYSLNHFDVGSNRETTLLVSECNGEFVSGIVTSQLLLTQFHPEKSYCHGDRVLRSFLANA